MLLSYKQNALCLLAQVPIYPPNQPLQLLLLLLLLLCQLHLLQLHLLQLQLLQLHCLQHAI